MGFPVESRSARSAKALFSAFDETGRLIAVPTPADLYLTNDHYIELIHADHECAQSVPFLP